MAQWVRHVLSKCEDLSSNVWYPSTIQVWYRVPVLSLPAVN